MRLELALVSEVYLLAEFQFHKGAIRTRFAVEIRKVYQSFQFHKGAIRTVMGLCPKPHFLYFNSIKVRLEPTEISLADLRK